MTDDSGVPTGSRPARDAVSGRHLTKSARPRSTTSPWEGSGVGVTNPLLNQTIGGRYLLQSVLGSGGMAVVYRARDLLSEDLVAVKLMHASLALRSDQRERFLREARAATRVNHEHVVEVLDFGESSRGLVYLVMEFIEGPRLSDVIAKGPMAPIAALQLVDQVASALARAHQLGVIHRDVKPSNIVVTQDSSGRDKAKILDFGVAKMAGTATLTGTEDMMGTPGFIAPEYIESADIDGRADLYSLGCVLYEMVTGLLPFDYEYPGELLMKHLREPPVPPSRRVATIEPALDAFVLRALEKRPEDRFRDAFHFRSDLRRVRRSLSAASKRSLSKARRPKAVAVRSSPFLPTVPEGTRRPDLTQEPAGERLSDTGNFEAVVPGGVIRDRTGAIQARERYLGVKHWMDAIAREQMIPRPVMRAFSQATALLKDMREPLDRMEAMREELLALSRRGRELRRNLGAAADQVAFELSDARGEFEALVARRKALRPSMGSTEKNIGEESDDSHWELAAVEEAMQTKALDCDALEKQVNELQQQLESHHEYFEAKREVLVGTLESHLAQLAEPVAELGNAMAPVEEFIRHARCGEL